MYNSTEMEKKELIIIKLGGGVITYKDSHSPKARLAVIKKLAKDVRKLVDKGYRIVLVHGAGSFGHPLANKYKLQKGMYTPSQKKAFALIQVQMIKLNSLITKGLIDEDVPAVTIPPHTLAKKSNHELLRFDHTIIEEYIKFNLVPVLFGDTILDDKTGCSILSGDTIVTHLAKKMQPKKVIFLTDVDGIYDCDPKKNPCAKLIPEISNSNLEEVLKGATVNNPNDVTGEMHGKILEIKNNLPKKDVFIINGLKLHTVEAVILGQQIGTHLRLK